MMVLIHVLMDACHYSLGARTFTNAFTKQYYRDS